MSKWPALTTGFAFGAFIDGIVFHQLLQWHHFVAGYRSTDDLSGLQYNTLWDGIFHAGSWIVLAAGVLWLWANRNNARNFGLRPLIGLMIAGWGVFNVVDEIVFHLLLRAHHIRMVENWFVYDATYTAIGLVLILAGWRIARSADSATVSRSS